MLPRIFARRFGPVLAVLLLVGTGSSLAQAPACNFKWAGVCYADLASAEAAMRATDATHALLVADPSGDPDDGTLDYYIESIPELTEPVWRIQDPSQGAPAPVDAPLFATEAEAFNHLQERAALPNASDPTKISSDDLIFRGEFVQSGKLRRQYGHNFTGVPITYINTSDFTDYRLCTQYTEGMPEARISRAFHFTYSPDSQIPPALIPNIRSLGFNNCIQPDNTWYRIYGLPMYETLEQGIIPCLDPYTSENNLCVNPLTAQIEVATNYLGTPDQIEKPCTEANPCNPANGNKYQTEVDYSTSGNGGLNFVRYYNSKGSYKTGANMGAGWRHNYSRTLNERPDRKPTLTFAAPVDQSAAYTTPADACTLGWTDIKDTTWSGDLSAATATFSGGNTCKIESAGNTVAYFPVRSSSGWAGFAAPSQINTITLANGSSITFEFDGTNWVSELDPSVSLIASGTDWIFTDANDTQETYDAGGRLVTIRYRDSTVETLDYDLTTAQGGDDDATTLDRITGPYGHTISLAYDGSGKLASIATPDGTFQYAYDGDENLVSVTQPDSEIRQYVFEDTALPNHLTGLIDENDDRFSTWSYDSSGRAVLSEHAGSKEQVQFAYNGDGSTTLTMGNGAVRNYVFATEQGNRKVAMLTGDVCSTCPGGNIADRTYDANGFIDEIVDWNGNTTQTVRNSRGLTETLIEAKSSTEQRTTTTVWHPTFRLPTQITSPKNVTDLIYDANGNVESITVTGGLDSRAWNFTYNGSGQPLTIDGPRTDVADVTTLTYYNCSTGIECGQIQSITNALSHITTYDNYDSAGRLTQMTDPNGLVTAFSYDSGGNLLSTTQTPVVGSARVTAMTYDGADQLETISTPEGMVLTYAYDAAHYLRSVTDNLGNSIDYDYDSMGNLQDEDTFDSSSALKRAIDYVYDINNRLDTISNGGFVTDLTTDLVGNLTNELDPESAPTTHSYDALNRLDQTIDALSGNIDYVYDDHDNVTSVAAANGATTTYLYDDLDNLTQESSPDRGVTIYTYDDAGNRTSELDARGMLTSYSYDALNRLTLASLNDGGSITYQYDVGANAIGRLNRIIDATGQTDWTYDNFGAATQKTQTIGTVALTTAYSYDNGGRMATMTMPSGKVVTYGYNTYQQDSITVDGNTILSGATYDPFGPVNAWTWGNGSFASRNFDLRGLPTSIDFAGDTQTLAYDDAGRVTSQIDTNVDQSYDYDLLGRLTDYSNNNASGPGGPLFSAPPVLLTSIQTMKNEVAAIPSEPSSPWMTVATKNVTATSAKVSLERSQANTGSIDVKEKIGYLAIEEGSGGSFLDSFGNTIDYEAQITPANIQGWDNGCFTTNFQNVYASKPVVMASPNSHNGNDGGWFRRCSLNKTALGLTVDEDKFADAERGHNNSESAGIVAFSAAFDAQFADSNGAWGMEIAKVTLPSTAVTPAFTSITFRQAYATKPVVIVLPNKSGNSPAAVRIRNVTTTGFEVVQVEPTPENGTHNSMPIHYLAIETGTHELPDGTKLEAGRKSTKKQQHGSGVVGNESWATINFSSTQSDIASQVFTYNPNGNRTSNTEDGSPFTYTNLANSNRLLSTTGPTAKTYSHDTAGNIIGDGIQTFGYDDRGRLVDVDSGAATYEHNGQGQRIRKDNGDVTLFVYNEFSNLIGEYDSNGLPAQETVWFNGAPVAILQGTNEFYVHTDHLGTPRVVTNGNTVIWRWRSDPFGSSLAEEDPDGDSTIFTYNLRFRGQYFDSETKLHYNYYRTYDPATGRYLESDPIGLRGGLNTFEYVVGNPLSYFDPFGLDPTLNIFPSNEQIYHNAQKIPDPQAGVISVAGHGNRNMMVRRFSQRLDAQRLAEIIRALDEFEGAKKIQLLSCNVGKGEDSLAQQLADELGIPVEAPNKFIFIGPNGEITIADPLPESVNPENEFDLSNAVPDPNNLGESIDFQPR